MEYKRNWNKFVKGKLWTNLISATCLDVDIYKNTCKTCGQFNVNFYYTCLKSCCILPPFPKDLPSFRLRVFPKDLPSFDLFLVWQNKFPYLPSHVTIIWSTITLLIQFYSISLSYLTPFYLFIYLNPFLSPTLLTPCPTQLDFPWYL